MSRLLYPELAFMGEIEEGTSQIRTGELQFDSYPAFDYLLTSV